MRDFEAAKQYLAEAHEHAAAGYWNGSVGRDHHEAQCLHFIRCAVLSLGYDVATFARIGPDHPAGRLPAGLDVDHPEHVAGLDAITEGRG